MARKTTPRTPKRGLEQGDQRRRRFLHVPPISRRGRDTPARVKVPYADAPRWQCSVYYFWWEFLRCHDGYRQRCLSAVMDCAPDPYAQLYADFGNVHQGTFLQWWNQRGETLFAEPMQRLVTRITDPKDMPNDPEIAVVTIPLTNSLRTSIRDIRRMLAAEVDALKQQGRSRALYPVVHRPVLSALWRTLSVYRAHQQYPHLRLYELAEQLQMSIPSGSAGVMENRRWQTNEIARHLRRAQRLIHHVALGVFPARS
jgi:hypothetical protein